MDILVNEAGADMNKIGADYIILGSFTEFGRKTEGEQKVFSSTKTQTVEAGVSIRLVEASTGLIIYSDEAKGFAETSTKQTMGLGGSAGYDATLSDKAIIHGIRSQNHLDEAASAYKNIDEVMANQQDLVKIITKLSPLDVVKG